MSRRMGLGAQLLVALGFVTILFSTAKKVFATDFSQQASIWGIVFPKAAIARELSSDRTALFVLRSEESPALLRLRILPKDSDPWAIEIYLPGLAEPLLLNSGNWRDFTVYEDVIEIFAPSEGDVYARAVKGSPAISYEEVVVLSDAYRFQPRFKVGKLTLDHIPQEIDTTTPAGRRIIENGRAVTLLSYDYAGYKGRCTASQVAPGLFLTNLHCVTNKTGEIHPQAGITLFFGDGDFSNLEYPSFPAKRKAKLLTNAYGEGEKSHEKKWPLDYALLSAEVPAGFETAILPLNQGKMPIFNTHLELYQIWQGSEEKAGKVVSRDSQCIVVTRTTVQGGCTAQEISHQCDSEGGSSGSPVVIEGGNMISGLHFWGYAEDVGNCALPANRILDDVKKKREDLWTELVKASQEKVN